MRGVVVVAKLGWFDRASVVVDGNRYPARRDREAWSISNPADTEDVGRVTYENDVYRLTLERGGETVKVDFPGDPVIFTVRRESYEMRPMDLGDIRIDRLGMPVVRGRSTASGVRFDLHLPELDTIIRELALGLALYSEALSREHRIRGPATSIPPGMTGR